MRRGLGDQAIRYVLDGENETVLASLSSSCSGNELEACESYLRHDSPSWLRRQLLAQQDPFDAEFTKRYTEVLSATCATLPDSACGSNKAAKDVRLLFSEAFAGVAEDSNRWPPKAVPLTNKGLTLSRAMTMTQMLGRHDRRPRGRDVQRAQPIRVDFRGFVPHSEFGCRLIRGVLTRDAAITSDRVADPRTLLSKWTRSMMTATLCACSRARMTSTRC